LQGDEPLGFQYRCASSPRDEPSTTGGNVLGPRTRPVSNDSVREVPGGEQFLHPRACLIHKVLRFSQAGYCYPPRLDRTNRALPHGSSLAANRDPHGFLDKGDVMIHRPYLVAGPVGSDWRTRRPRLVLHLDDRSKK
jgi:hypothetical protein